MPQILAGFAEAVEIGPEFIFIQGWINLNLHRRSVDSREDINVSFFEKAVFVGTSILVDLYDRPDLGGADSQRKAFRCLAFTSKEIRGAIVIRLESAARNVELPQLNPPAVCNGTGALEDVAGWGISGWVWNPCGRRVTIQIDGFPPLDLRLRHIRDDLPPTFAATSPNGLRLSYEDINAIGRSFRPRFAILDGQDHTIHLCLGAHAVASMTLSVARQYQGKVERYENNVLRGWACPAGGGGETVMVDVCVGGTRYATCTANFDRSDLVRKGLVRRGGGFAVPVHRMTHGPGGDRTITARFHLNGKRIPGAAFPIEQQSLRWASLPDLSDTLPSARPEISVIVPIYNAFEDLERCLASLEANTTLACRLILIDDASPDPRIKELLYRHAELDRVEVVLCEQNRGFTKTVNLGIEIAGTDDVVFLNSDTMVTPRWLENLVVAAYHRPRVGTVTPLSDNAGAFSVPEIGVKNWYPPASHKDEIARLVTQVSAADYPEVPTGNGFCLYVKRACIDAVGGLDEAAFPSGYGEENDFCQRAQRRGFSNIVDDRTLVYHTRSASFGEQKSALYSAGRAKLDTLYPEYRKQIEVFRSGPALLDVRWRIRHGLAALEAGTIKVRPRLLFVIATETGGTPQTNRDLMAELEADVDPHLLRCTSRQIILTRFEAGQDLPLIKHDLRQEISISQHTSSEYDRCVGELLLTHAIELVHIRHIAWHSLNLIRICRKLSIPVVFSFHDFYTVCPNTKLLDENNVHCAGVCTPTAGRCQAELWPPASVPPLKHQFVRRWRAMLGDVLRLCDAFVTTAESAAAILRAAFPDLDFERKLTIIPHGRSFGEMQALGVLPEPGEPLRVLVPGNISAAKGAMLIADIVDLDQGASVEFHILGDAGRLRAGPGLVVHGPYKRDEIASHIAQIRPHIGTVLSIWPETYCHTLSEMWACGIPVLGFKVGAVGDRLTETGAGWTLPLGSTALAVLVELQGFRSRPEDIGRRTEQVMAWQQTTGRHYGTAAMAERYGGLYAAVMGTRREFCGAMGRR